MKFTIGNLVGILLMSSIGYAANTLHQFDDVEALMDKIEDYQNVEVSVSGEVEKVDANSFVLEGGGIVDDEILVVFAEDMDSSQKQLIRDDADVEVQGTVKKGRVLDSENELKHRFSAEIRSKLGRTDNYLIAKSVTQKAR